MNKKHFYTVVILLSFLTIGIQPAFSAKQIINDGENGTGGDAASIGTWDWGTLTCTLTQDVYETIEIKDNGITLDGNGHTIDLDLSGGFGVSLPGVPPDEGTEVGYTYVTIKNLNIVNCDEGIHLKYVNHIDIINNNVSNCQYGIYMYRAGTCINWEGREGITGNNIVSNDHGIWVQSCKVIDIYRNNFIDNGLQAVITSTDPKLPNVDINFYLPLPTGGNYWSDWGPPDTADDDNNGIWDDPYIVQPVGSFQDNYPWVVKNGWLGPGVLIVQLIDTVEDMNLQ